MSRRKDAERIVRVLANCGVEVTEDEAVEIWELHSDYGHAAGWLGLPDEDVDLAEVLMNEPFVQGYRKAQQRRDVS